MKKWSGLLVFTIVFFLLLSSMALALDVNDKLSIEGYLAGAYQYQSLSDAQGYDDTGRGGLAFQPAVRMQLTQNDVIFARFGFGAGNGLTDGTSPFNLNPWSADLEAGVKGINGRDRDYLLTAGYGHLLDLGTSGKLDLIGGILDATEYLDNNAYANSGLTQFMNSALVNSHNAFLPSYDLGGAAQWEKDAWSASAVIMNVAENVDGNSYNFYGVEAGYTLKLAMGEGHYRLNVNKTTDDFTGPNSTAKQSKTGILTSCDQQLGEIFGVWVRLGWQEDDAFIDYKNLISGGVDIKGTHWSRENDNIGIGYAFLDGGNLAIDQSEVLEIYYRFALNDYSALTLDFQYIEEEYTDGTAPTGLISGLRFAAAF